MNAVIDFLNLIFWNYILIYGLLAVGLYFTIRLGFPQFRHFPELFRCVIGSGQADKNQPVQMPLKLARVAMSCGVGARRVFGHAGS